MVENRCFRSLDFFYSHIGNGHLLKMRLIISVVYAKKDFQAFQEIVSYFYKKCNIVWNRRIFLIIYWRKCTVLYMEIHLHIAGAQHFEMKGFIAVIFLLKLYKRIFYTIPYSLFWIWSMTTDEFDVDHLFILKIAKIEFVWLYFLQQMLFLGKDFSFK